MSVAMPSRSHVRPHVSVVLPFAGSRAEIEAALDAIAQLRREPGDEVIVVDNSGAAIVPELDDIRVIRASREPSAYYARNEGAEVANNEWLLFIDADCRPVPDLLDRYFEKSIPDVVGAVIGEVNGVPDQSSIVSRYARSRGHLHQEMHWKWPFRPWGITANLLVRREAWASVGGFQEGIRSGGDAEFSWRLQDLDWQFAYRPYAIVEHAHRDTLRRLARQAGRYGAGRAWVMQRYPAGFRRPTLVRRLGRCMVGVAAWMVSGQRERALFKALDAVYVVSEWSAYWLMSNATRGDGPGSAGSVALIADVFPELAAERVELVVDEACVLAVHRPVRVDRELARRIPVSYLEDDGGFDRVRGAFALLLARPGELLRRPREAFVLGAAVRRIRRAQVGSIRAIDDTPAVTQRAILVSRLAGLPLDCASLPARREPCP